MKSKKTKAVVVAEGKFIRFLRKDGWEYVQRSNCTSIVIVLAMTQGGKVILTEQFRPPVNKKVIEFPAGLVNDHAAKRKESYLTAAKRELFEETGYKAKRIKKVLEGPVSGGLTSDRFQVVRAYDLSKEGSGGGDDTESIRVHEVPLDSVEGWLSEKQKKGYLVDPKVYAGLYFLQK